jgi:hypothetical protein
MIGLLQPETNVTVAPGGSGRGLEPGPHLETFTVTPGSSSYWLPGGAGGVRARARTWAAAAAAAAESGSQGSRSRA